MAFLLQLFKRLGMFFLILLVIYAIARPTQIWLDGFYSGERGPYLQMMSPDAVTLRWQGKEKTVGIIRYGLQADQLDQLQRETQAGEEHEIRLTGLKPATKYFYSAGSEKDTMYQGESFWFKTAPGGNAATRFWVTGDQGYPGKIQYQVRDAMLRWLEKNPRLDSNNPPLDLWLTTGDNAYRSGSNKQFQAGFFEPYKNILRNTPVWPVYGNHDARRWVFFDIFTFPTKAESGGLASDTENYYSFDYANIHFVILDTQESSMDKDDEMLIWLKQDLEQTKQQWLIALFHHPPYTKGSHDSDDKWDSFGRLIKARKNILPVLENSGVDLVFTGHSHLYERSEMIGCHYGNSSTFKSGMIRAVANNKIYKKEGNYISANSGTIYTVLGSSSKVDNGALNHPALPYSFNEAGSMIFDVNKNVLKAYFINKDGKVRDQFEIRKGVVNGVGSKSCH